MVEFAMLAPLLFMLLFGVTEMGFMFNAWVSVQDAAERGARYAVTGRASCTTGGASRAGCIDSQARTALNHITDGSSATVSLRSWKYPTYTALTAGDPGKACDAVEVKVTYSYHPRIALIGALIGQPNLTARQRFINEPFGPCLTF